MLRTWSKSVSLAPITAVICMWGISRLRSIIKTSSLLSCDWSEPSHMRVMLSCDWSRSIIFNIRYCDQERMTRICLMRPEEVRYFNFNQVSTLILIPTTIFFVFISKIKIAGEELIIGCCFQSNLGGFSLFDHGSNHQILIFIDRSTTPQSTLVNSLSVESDICQISLPHFTMIC